MSGTFTGASKRLRWVALGVLTVLTTIIVTSDPADARSRRRGHHARATSSYSPPPAAIVIDGNSGAVMYQSNPDALRHPASLTKIMTLYLLFERLESGKMKLDTEMNVSAHAASQAPTKLGLRPGQTIEVEDAIKALVTKSANDASVVIAEAIAGDEDDFAQMMTQKARALGMSRTVYKNANGLPDEDQVTTARDQARLGMAIQERFPRYYKYFSTASFTYRGHAMRNHNRLLGQVEGVDGIKTGFTRASGFNLVTSVRRGNRHLVSVVLGGASAGARDARMRSLISEYVMMASTTKTATKIAESRTEPAEAEPRQAKAYSMASAASVPVNVPPAPVRAAAPMGPAAVTAAVAAAPVAHAAPAAKAPSLGSTDPIRPRLVKTISVKPGAKPNGVQMAALGPLPVGSAGTVTETAAVAAEVEKTASLPQNSLATSASRPGSLGTLTVKHGAIVAPAAATAPAPVETSSINALVNRSAAETGAPARAQAATSDPSRHKPQVRSGWMIQVGAFTAETEAKEKLNAAQSQAKKLLGDADPFTEPYVKGDTTYYRARFAGLAKDQAEAVCKQLKRNDFACMAIRN
jgi:D-alanyl-D-alanine carboxypeptidase